MNKVKEEGRFRGYLIIIFGVLILSIVIYCLANSSYIDLIIEKNVSVCFSNEECVKQQVTCCPCSMGGKEECMTQKQAEAMKEKLRVLHYMLVKTLLVNVSTKLV